MNTLSTQPPRPTTPRQRLAVQLIRHLNTDGSTLNDAETERLYCQWHRLPEGTPTDLEEVELWALRIGL